MASQPTVSSGPTPSRRDVLKTSVAATLAAGALPASAAADPPVNQAAFESDWPSRFDGVWLGADYWANPLQDWRIASGRAECINAAFDRNVHLLTHYLADEPGELTMSVRIGRMGGGKLSDGKGSFGFRLGIKGPMPDRRSGLFGGQGLNCGVTAAGGLFVGILRDAKPGTVPLDVAEVLLTVSLTPKGAGHSVKLTVADAATRKPLGEVVKDVGPDQMLGGSAAIVANFGQARPAGQRQQPANNDGPPNFGTGQFWFADWKGAGSKVRTDLAAGFGPICWTSYTVHNRILKLTAQFVPVAAEESQSATLMVQDTLTKEWKNSGEAKIDPDSRTATFRVEKWKTKYDVPYRVMYTQKRKGKPDATATWDGVVKKDPADQPIVTVADISCNAHQAFPNAEYVANTAKLKPDLLAFVGDQFYESTGGYGVVRKPVDTAILDYLRKWYAHGWTWRELMRNTPCISLPDDHDVYQGNIWGEGGAARTSTQEAGGYDMDPRWVNVVHRTQTEHHPDPADPKPAAQGIRNYFGPLTVGRISFAVLADRMYKSAPEGKVPPTCGRGDHVKDPRFDPKSANLPGLKLLGDSQMQFLKSWAEDWAGADMKAVISQTIFTGMATHHGGERMKLIADYDANGWPQAARNEALREIRKCRAVHLAGDQHLPAVVHYGIDQPGDAAVAFAGPAVNVIYPRWFEPDQPGKNRKPGTPDNTGDFTDSFGHPLRVLAVQNPKVEFRKPVIENMIDRASGVGIVRFDKPNRKVTFECWPFGADSTQPNTQSPGWPVTVSPDDCDGRKPIGTLPAITMRGDVRPVIKLYKQPPPPPEDADPNNPPKAAAPELVYAIRPVGERFEPPVYEEGTYLLKVGDPDSDRWQEFPNLTPKKL